jgi:hypothetical protein
MNLTQANHALTVDIESVDQTNCALAVDIHFVEQTNHAFAVDNAFEEQTKLAFAVDSAFVETNPAFTMYQLCFCNLDIAFCGTIQFCFCSGVHLMIIQSM